MANNYAHAPNQVLQSKGSAKKMVDALSYVYNYRWSVAEFNAWSIDEKNSRGVYPITQVGSAPSRWYRQSGVVDNGITQDGHWQETRQWKLMPLDQIKIQAKSEVQTWKIAMQDSDFTFKPDGVTDVAFQNGGRSRQMLVGASLQALMAEITPPTPAFSVDWTASDDSIHTLDAATMIGLGQASALFVGTHHKTSTQAKADIDAAADDLEVQAVLDGLPPLPENE